MPVPLVSVIIPSYNAARFLPDALESVLAQTYPHYEIIVVDDGSTDNTAQVVQPYLLRIRYLKQDNRGIGAARNAAIAMSRGDFIALLDADDLWLPHKLALQVSLMLPETGLVGSSRAETDPSGTLTRGVSYEELLVRNRFCASSVLFRRGCIDDLGGFNDTGDCFGVEDWELWLRISRKYRALYVSNRMLIVRQCEGSVSSVSNAEKMLLAEKAVLRLQARLEDGHIPGCKLLAEAWSHVYVGAAWANLAAGHEWRAMRRLLCALLLYPPMGGRRVPLGLLLCILKSGMVRHASGKGLAQPMTGA
jgi:glycosyltransferase involved in cell wall biosynthesis